LEIQAAPHNALSMTLLLRKALGFSAL